MVFGQEGANAYVCTPKILAQMAELVDASDSKSGIGNNVQVRFLFWAQRPSDEVGGLFCLGAREYLCKKSIVQTCYGTLRGAAVTLLSDNWLFRNC